PNPYAAPTTTSASLSESGDDAGSLAVVRQELAATRPWVLFVSILGILAGCFYVLAGLANVGLGISEMGSRRSMGGTSNVIAGFCVMAFSSVLFYQFSCLYKFGTKIAEFERATSIRLLEAALRQQKAFWRLAGIMAAVMLACLVLGILLTVV